MRLIRASLLLAVLPLLPACEPGICAASTTNGALLAAARSANGVFMVTVVDTRGNPVRDARVTYTPEGGTEQPAWCAESFGSDQNCERWTGGDGEGTYLVRATSADGSRSAEQNVSVRMTSCSIESDGAHLTLPD
ncbi:hypothetical protein F0U60_32175 [Archangium minus]|uniref:Lipoprotein n=1 Tax=Archangium minus TaxID=83450 RepID=A0ABY9WYN8_9BACT|nr:hypothetical protein F0U60_32175 [Archangium minus]